MVIFLISREVCHSLHLLRPSASGFYLGKCLSTFPTFFPAVCFLAQCHCDPLSGKQNHHHSLKIWHKCRYCGYHHVCMCHNTESAVTILVCFINAPSLLSVRLTCMHFVSQEVTLPAMRLKFSHSRRLAFVVLPLFVTVTFRILEHWEQLDLGTQQRSCI